MYKWSKEHSRRPIGSSFIRGECLIENCISLQRSKGMLNGKNYFDRFCNKHHRIRFGVEEFPVNLNMKRNLDNTKCKRCGWSEGPCDRHRLIPEKGYVEGNVVSLCPNCHRLVTLNLISL